MVGDEGEQSAAARLLSVRFVLEAQVRGIRRGCVIPSPSSTPAPAPAAPTGPGAPPPAAHRHRRHPRRHGQGRAWSRARVARVTPEGLRMAVRRAVRGPLPVLSVLSVRA